MPARQAPEVNKSGALQWMRRDSSREWYRRPPLRCLPTGGTRQTPRQVCGWGDGSAGTVARLTRDSSFRFPATALTYLQDTYLQDTTVAEGARHLGRWPRHVGQDTELRALMAPWVADIVRAAPDLPAGLRLSPGDPPPPQMPSPFSSLIP